MPGNLSGDGISILANWCSGRRKNAEKKGNSVFARAKNDEFSTCGHALRPARREHPNNRPLIATGG
ncbi:hypothetical protein [Streptomyces sp. NPDC001508]|uniref:hypothetical protein n=1 Tax=Streptomyces sp. NPDC001508 TaxID=3154656 RepID=UPI00331CB452